MPISPSRTPRRSHRPGHLLRVRRLPACGRRPRGALPDGIDAERPPCVRCPFHHPGRPSAPPPDSRKRHARFRARVEVLPVPDGPGRRSWSLRRSPPEPTRRAWRGDLLRDRSRPRPRGDERRWPRARPYHAHRGHYWCSLFVLILWLSTCGGKSCRPVKIFRSPVSTVTVSTWRSHRVPRGRRSIRRRRYGSDFRRACRDHHVRHRGACVSSTQTRTWTARTSSSSTPSTGALLPRERCPAPDLERRGLLSQKAPEVISATVPRRQAARRP